MSCTFQIEKLRDKATIGWKFAPLFGLKDDDMGKDTMIITYKIAMSDVASEIPGKIRRRKRTGITKNVLELCDERRDLKQRRCED